MKDHRAEDGESGAVRLGRPPQAAADSHDYPRIMGITIVVAAAVVGINLLTDLSHALIDPRIAPGAGGGEARG
ncbi:MAG TPA: hypothetical protein VFL28_14580 [bacterium]|nr:hypothetical protein [bacterium]